MDTHSGSFRHSNRASPVDVELGYEDEIELARLLAQVKRRPSDRDRIVAIADQEPKASMQRSAPFAGSAGWRDGAIAPA